MKKPIIASMVLVGTAMTCAVAYHSFYEGAKSIAKGARIIIEDRHLESSHGYSNCVYGNYNPSQSSLTRHNAPVASHTEVVGRDRHEIYVGPSRPSEQSQTPIADCAID